MSGYVHPACGKKTVYQLFSGGREWYCESCDETGEYPEGETPRRVKLLQSEAGRSALRAEMAQELARREDER